MRMCMDAYVYGHAYTYEVRAAAVRGVAAAAAAGADVLDVMKAGADAMEPVVEAKLGLPRGRFGRTA